MLLYITANKNKIAIANRLLQPYGLTVQGLKVDGITEPQSEDIQEISIAKAKQAYEIIKKPLIVSDSGWIIPALNGFPGPYMAFVNSWFTAQDFLNLMKDKKNKEIILRECVTYIDDKHTISFITDTKGFFVEEQSGKATPLDQVVSFREDRKTLAKCENEGIRTIPQNELWSEVGDWLKTNRLI